MQHRKLKRDQLQKWSDPAQWEHHTWAEQQSLYWFDHENHVYSCTQINL